MPKGKPLSASDWKSSASLNTSINSINIAEGCPRANVNDGMRSMMSDLKNFGKTIIGINTPVSVLDFVTPGMTDHLPAINAARAWPSGRAEGLASVIGLENNRMEGCDDADLICRFFKPSGCSIARVMTDRLKSDLDSGALTEALADIAEDAARVILPYWRNGVAVETKADDSPVTLADQQAEALILARLETLYPGIQTSPRKLLPPTARRPTLKTGSG